MRYQSLALLAMVCSVILAREDTAELCTGALSVYDEQDLPRVISYKELGQGSAKDLAKKLADQGSHVSPDELKSGITVESILEGGLAEKEKMVTTSNGDSARQGSTELDIHALMPANVVHLPSSPSDSPEGLGALLAENVSGNSDSKATPADAKSDARKLTASVAGTAAIGAFAWFF
ncbi:hypothetical protein BGZ95_008216 [Linnemannia exigua]|uniref:Uncharacterized protein n=1 Tax=Linnemannia exigua TaxID=604196 RepID=A0AAD4DEH0_9FUNG|nr:hypothetical protein BGZ95_008216 [Linnemannia exigua]